MLVVALPLRHLEIAQAGTQEDGLMVRRFANAFTRKLLLARVGGLGAGLVFGTTMWVRGIASSTTSPPAAVHECYDNTSKVVTFSSTATCPSGTTAIAALAKQSRVTYLYNQVSNLQSEVSSLQNLLAGVSRGTANGYDTLFFSGMNLQVLNGTGNETAVNGLGNLIVGYDDNGNGYSRTGSHNLIAGDNGGWTSYGGLLAGNFNEISGIYASVSGGGSNVASGPAASVSGGGNNGAFGQNASVSGGDNNTASGLEASVSGGDNNFASYNYAAVSGGYKNTASNGWASVSGGLNNTASGVWGSVSGGRDNTASGDWDAI